MGPSDKQPRDKVVTRGTSREGDPSWNEQPSFSDTAWREYYGVL